MWIINDISFDGLPSQYVWFSDGLPINTQRGANGISCRVMIGTIGFMDITDLGEVPSPGNSLAALDINGEMLYYDKLSGCAMLMVTVSSPNRVSISYGGNPVNTTLFWYPGINSADIALINEMEADGYIPFRNDPNTHKTPAEIKKRLEELGKQYFPFTEYGYQLALSIYDWTTADFFRMDLFHLYCYTSITGTPRNINEMAQGLASSDWGTYKITNVDFMNSFMLQPMTTLQEVLQGLADVNEKLGIYLNALARITLAAKYALPRVSLAETPMLYSGQVAIRNLTNDAMAAYFLECPLNAGPVGTPIAMSIDDALAGFMAPGNTVTLKSFISFTAYEQEAEQYSNGLLLVLSPKPGSHVWGEGITNITPLSDQPQSKNEYTFSPGAQIQINSFEKKNIGGKELTVINMTYLDRMVPVPGITN